MLFVSITSLEQASWIEDPRLGIELRLDLFVSIDLVLLRDFLRDTKRCVLVTFRSTSQGGGFQGTCAEQEQFIRELLCLKPDFFDLEEGMRDAFLSEVIAAYPEVQFILSSHHTHPSLPDLEGLLQKMERHQVFCYKIAAVVSSTTDALQMLLFGKKNPKVSVICMGEAGQFARVLGPVVGNRVDFACVKESEQTAPGQLSADELIECYRYFLLNQETAIYGLIGDPVRQSPGHRHHNRVFHERGVNAVYVKMRLQAQELEGFMTLAHALNIRGLSVTIPFKEQILEWLDEINPDAEEMGSVNTVLLEKGRSQGTNTDGKGALTALEQKGAVHNKSVVILGAGGTARSIAFEAKKRGARVLILNRTIERALQVAQELGCQSGGLDAVPSDYDVLINCSPTEMPIGYENIVAESVVMDVVYQPKQTPLLALAQQKGCAVVYGEEMFFNQAALQTVYWLGEEGDVD